MRIVHRVVATFWLIALVVGLTLGAGVASAADAQTSDPSKAIPVSASRLTGSLPALPKGAWPGSNRDGFAYYKFDYPGNLSNISINMQVWPDNETLGDLIGFTIYGPRTAREPGYIYTNGNAQPRLVPNVTVDLGNNEPGTYVVQVWNEANIPISYELWVTGLPGPKPGTAVAVAVATPAPTVKSESPATVVETPFPLTSTRRTVPPPAAPVAEPVIAPPVVARTGSLDPAQLVVPPSVLGEGWSIKDTGDLGSNDVIQLAQIDYQGPLADKVPGALLSIIVTPDDETRESMFSMLRTKFEGLGYTFQPNSEFGDRPGVRGTKLDGALHLVLRYFSIGNVVVAVLVGGDSEAIAGRTVTQLAVAEQAIISKAMGIPPPTSGAVSATDNPDVLTGTLRPGGSELFSFLYPGDDSVYTINAHISPGTGAILDRAGFQVFAPNGNLQVKGGNQVDLRPNVSANVISRTKGIYVVKVFNDHPNVAVTFSLTLVKNPPDKK